MNLNTNLPTIQNNEELKQAVEAKELYKSLGLNTAHWAKWHHRNIDTNTFAIEGLDYQGYTQRVNGNESKNYLLSIDFAKKLSMQVRTEKGEEVRQYFLDCEESAKQASYNLPTTYLEALKALLSSEEQKQVIQHQLEAAAPKINHYDTVVERTNLMTATQVGQKLGMTANKLNKHLEALGAYNKSVKRGRAFKQWFIDNDYGVMKEANKGYSQALITSKGQAYIVQELTFNKSLPEADIERIAARQSHTLSVINTIDNLLEY